MELKDIKYDKKNYRKHSDQNKALIKKSIQEVGLGRSVVIDSENELIAGNGVVSQLPKGTKIKVIETDGSELVVVKRTDLKTADEKRKKLALMDNSAGDAVDWDLANLSEDFDLAQLGEYGITNLAEDVELAQEELMNNDLDELQTNKMLSLSRMPISSYLVISFDEDHTKEDFIELVAKKYNEKANITVKTQYCDFYFNKKDMLNDAE